MGVVGGLVEEQVVDDDAFHRRQRRDHMLGVRIGLQDVLALHVEPHEGAFDGRVEHVGNAQARLVVELDVPHRLELLAHRVAGDMAIARQLVRERAHVAGALHVVLAAQRVHADAGTADIAGDHREVGDRDHRGRALAMFGDAEAVIDRAVAAGGEQTRGFTQFLRIDAGHDGGGFGRVVRLGDERRPVLELAPVAALADEGFIREAFGDDDVRDRREHGDIGAGHQGQMVLRLDMGGAHDVGAARINHDQSGTGAQPLFQARGEHRMTVGRVGADDHHDVGVFHRVEVLRAGGGAEGRGQAVAGRRVADSGAGVDVVVAEAGADQLLHHEDFFIGAARRGDAADRIPAVFGLDALELLGGEIERLVPRHFLPRVGDLLAHHRVEDALLVVGIAPGEAALDAGMAAIGLAVLERHHADDFLAAHLRLEGAADAAIGAGSDDRMLGLADLDHGLLGQRRRRAGLHAGAAGDAFRAQEAFVHAGRDAAFETTTRDGQRESALHFLAGADAARADDAFRGIIGEVRIALVLRHPVVVLAVMRRMIVRVTFRLGEDVVLAVIAVAHVAQADRAGHVLQFAVAVGGAGQAVQRMVGDIQLHHALAELLQPRVLGVNDQAFHRRCGARRRRAGAALDLDEAEPARAVGVHHVGGAEFRNLRAHLHGGAHDRGALGHRNALTVDGQRDHLLSFGARSTEIDFVNERHWRAPLFCCLQAGRYRPEIFREMLQGAHHRIRGEAAQRA